MTRPGRVRSTHSSWLRKKLRKARIELALTRLASVFYEIARAWGQPPTHSLAPSSCTRKRRGGSHGLDRSPWLAFPERVSTRTPFPHKAIVAAWRDGATGGAATVGGALLGSRPRGEEQRGRDRRGARGIRRLDGRGGRGMVRPVARWRRRRLCQLEQQSGRYRRLRWPCGWNGHDLGQCECRRD